MISNTNNDIDPDACCVPYFCPEEEVHEIYQILKTSLVQMQVVSGASALESTLVHETCQRWNGATLVVQPMRVVPIIASLEEELHQRYVLSAVVLFCTFRKTMRMDLGHSSALISERLCLKHKRV
jgi:hypothetical protein